VLGGASLLEAARYYIRRHPTKLPRKTVQEVVEEFIGSRREAKRSEEYVADLEYRLGRFGKAFQTAIADVSQSDVVRFIAGLGLSARSQYNFRKVLWTFFQFAKMQGYLPKDHEEMKGIDLGNADPGEIEIYTPKEMTSLLSAARPVMVPILAISGFAGLRSKELERLDWAEVQMERGFIELKRWC
jgi:integrase